MAKQVVDPTERVAPGQIGTGDATPYQGLGANPIAVYEATLAKRKPGSVAATNSKKNEGLKDIKPDWYWMHNAELQDKFDKLNKIGSELYSKGIDPENPASGQAYTLFQQGKSEFAREEMLSKQIGQAYDTTREKYSSNPDKYNPEAMKLINQWYQRPFSEIVEDVNRGAAPPSLETFEQFDEAKLYKEISAAVEPIQTESISPQGEQNLTTTVKKRDRNAVFNLVESKVLQNDKQNVAYREYETQFERLPESAKERINQLAKDAGKDPVAYYASEKVYGAVNGLSIDKSLSDMPSGQYFGTSDGKKQINQRVKLINEIVSGSAVDATPDQRTKANRLWNSIYSGKQVKVSSGSSFSPSKEVTIRAAFVDDNKSSPNYGHVVVEDMEGNKYKMHNMANYNERSSYLINQLLNDNTDGIKNKIPNESFIQYYKPQKADPLGILSNDKTKNNSTSTETDPLGIL